MTDGRQYQAIHRAALRECDARLEARDRKIDELRTECERLRARERQLYDALWTLDGHARLYMTLAQNVDEQTRAALSTPPPEGEYRNPLTEHRDENPAAPHTPEQAEGMVKPPHDVLRSALRRTAKKVYPQQAHGDALDVWLALWEAMPEEVAEDKWFSDRWEIIRRHLTASGVPEWLVESLRIIKRTEPERGDRLPQSIASECLEALASPPAVPSGYKLVPVEPTDLMIRAGVDELRDAGRDISEDEVIRRIWMAMQEAAPTDGRE